MGDDYISQHVLQEYRNYMEQTSYKVYMSNRARELVSIMSGTMLETGWVDILQDLDASVTPVQQTESESEIKSRILKKLNGREGEPGDSI